MVACVRESEEVNPYKLDAKLQAVIIAWYSNDPSVIDFFTDQKYTAGEYETYMEREGTTLDYKNILQSINAIYSCKEVNMTGSSGYSGSVAAGIAGTIDSGTRLSWLFSGRNTEVTNRSSGISDNNHCADPDENRKNHDESKGTQTAGK